LQHEFLERTEVPLLGLVLLPPNDLELGAFGLVRHVNVAAAFIVRRHPRVDTSTFLVEDRAVVQVLERFALAHDGFAVVLDGSNDRVPQQVQDPQVLHLRQHVHDAVVGDFVVL